MHQMMSLLLAAGWAAAAGGAAVGACPIVGVCVSKVQNGNGRWVMR